MDPTLLFLRNFNFLERQIYFINSRDRRMDRHADPQSSESWVFVRQTMFMFTFDMWAFRVLKIYCISYLALRE